VAHLWFDASIAKYIEAWKEQATTPSVVRIGPMPSILDVLTDLGVPKDQLEHLRVIPEGVLEFNGKQRQLVLPSLDTEQLRATTGFDQLKRITVCIGINSDAFNNGLGVVLEASSLVDFTIDEKGIPSYLYCGGIGYGISNDHRGNCVKFHPGMSGGCLRVEGPGGFGNQDIGFKPENWSDSEHRLNLLEITVGTDGKNEVRITNSTNPGQVWHKSWEHQIFSGRFMPAIFAWIDIPCDFPRRPVFVGPISIRVHGE